MTKHLTLLLFIGLAWGQLKVRSQFDLEPFTVSNVEQGTRIRFENGEMIKESTNLNVQFSGSFSCLNESCGLNIKYKTDKTIEMSEDLIDKIEDEDEKNEVLKWVNRSEEKELYFPDINKLIKAISELVDYNFGANETEVEYELTGGSIKRTIDPNNIMNPGKIFDLN